MSTDLHGTKVAFLVANEGVEQVELTHPWEALLEAGADLTLVAPEVGDVQAFNHLDHGDTFRATAASGDVDAREFDALVLPGGVANPDQLRTDDPSVALVRAFVEAGRAVAVICHGPWTLVEAGVVSGRTLTSWPSVRTDLTNAGATWVDEEVVVCTDGPNTMISSRNPDDLPAFSSELLRVLSSDAGTDRGAA